MSRGTRRVSERHDATVPDEQRRDHGVHYTPEEMAAEVVEHTLGRIFAENQCTSTFIRSLRVGDIAMGDGVFLVEACRYLAAQLAAAWEREGFKPQEDAVARFVVADECVFGVELDPVAVEKARANLAAFVGPDAIGIDMGATLQHGDALVGLDLEQEMRLDWERGEVSDHGSAASPAIRERCADAVVGAFFAHDKAKARRKELAARQPTLRRYLAGDESARAEVEAWSDAARAVTPVCHWHLRFPWLFTNWCVVPSRVGAFVGNPPFVGGGRISGALGPAYLDWVMAQWPEGGGRTDLCAYFFRRMFDLLGRGAMGVIATNTISQGDTRLGGLKSIVDSGGRIFRAHVNERWPGEASVLVSTVFISKGGVAPDEGCVIR